MNIPPNTTSVDSLSELASKVLSQPDTATSPSNEEEPIQETDEIGEKSNPVIRILGNDIDQDTFAIGVLLILIWILIWKTSGLWTLLKYDPVFIVIFFLFPLYTIINVYTSGTSSGGVVYELNILLTVEQMISILLGSVILMTMFNKNLTAPDTCVSIIFRLLISNVIILTIASMWINVITSGRAFRMIRKFKQGIYNIALTFLIIVGLIYVKGQPCTMA